MRKAKILATLGPASRDQAVIESLLRAGANGVRINMSHGTHEEKTEDIKRARAAAENLKRPLAVLVDLSGPKIRTRATERRTTSHAESRRAFHTYYSRHRGR